MRKNILASVLSGLVVSGYALTLIMPISRPVLAEGITNRSGDRAQIAQEEARARMQARCGVVESRIKLITTRYANNRQRHIDRYQKIKDKAADLLRSLESNNPGYDLSDLEADLLRLDNLIREFSEEYDALMRLLEQTKSIACGESEGAYLAKLSEVRAQNLKVRQAVLDTRMFVQSDLRPTIQQIREDLR